MESLVEGKCLEETGVHATEINPVFGVILMFLDYAQGVAGVSVSRSTIQST